MEISKISMQPLLPRSVPLAPCAGSFLAFPENRRLASLLVLEVMHVAKSQPQGAPHAPGSSIAKTPFSGLVLRRLSRSNMPPPGPQRRCPGNQSFALGQWHEIGKERD